MRRALFLSAVLLASAAQARPVTVSVTAQAETAPVGTANRDAADDPAIWRNRRDPEKSLIVATDKRAGLVVYGLDGSSRDFVAAGRVNNVDLVDMGRQGIIVAASDRNDPANAKVQLYRLDPVTAKLAALGAVSGGAGEGYGMCLLRQRGRLYAFSVLKHGAVHQIRLSLSGDAPTGEIVRSFSLATQSEGCVADPRTGTLYVGEEGVGIWAFDTKPNSPLTGRKFAAADGSQLMADVEGLALVPKGARGGWLIASSQGDNAYAVYDLRTMQPAGRFRIAAGRLGSTEETDGIAVATGNFGKTYPRGLFIAQDGDNQPAAQNFKLVSLEQILRALGK